MCRLCCSCFKTAVAVSDVACDVVAALANAFAVDAVDTDVAVT